MKKEQGVTIVELLVVIFVIGLFIAFFAPTILNRASDFARVNTTKQEMNEIRTAIMGDPRLISGGEFSASGFKSDLGRLPRHLVELATRHPENPPYDQYVYPNKESLPIWNPFTKQGWNGPYIRDDGNQSFIFDGWGDPYEFVVAGSDTIGIKSRGPDGEWFTTGIKNDDIEIRF